MRIYKVLKGVFRFLMGFGWFSRGSTFLGVSTVFQGYFTGCQGIHGFSTVFLGFQGVTIVFMGIQDFQVFLDL